jgi:hypothetical protein
MKEIKKVAVYLFSKDCPKGEMFSFYGGKDSVEYKKMLEEGWVDTPARLNLPKEMDTGITEDIAVNADPQRLINILEDYGFIVLTQEQLKAQAVKMAMTAIDMENFSDEEIIKEAERRGIKDSDDANSDQDDIVDDDDPDLLGKFITDKSSLSSEEKIALGKELGISLRSNWSDEVMNEKINEALTEKSKD